MILSFQPHHLIAVIRLAQDAQKYAPHRPAYHGWCVDFDPERGAWAVATNGSILLAAPAIDNNEKSTPEPLQRTYDLPENLRALRTKSTSYLIDTRHDVLSRSMSVLQKIDTEREEWDRLGLTRLGALSVHKHAFPLNWPKLIDEFSSRVSTEKMQMRAKFMFDPQLLTPITRALATGTRKRVYATIRFTNNDEPQVVKFSGASNSVLLCRLMLCREK